MTTQQPTPAPSDHDDQTAAATWESLGEAVRTGLKDLANQLWVSSYALDYMLKNGLAYYAPKDKNLSLLELTDAGRNLLASAPVSTSARPKTVTWKQLMTRGNEVFAAWLEDQCELCFVGYTIKSYDNEEKQMIFFMDGGMQPMSDDKVLTVRWRLPVPTASDAGETAEAADIRMKTNTPYDWNDFIEDISKALGREYDPETPVYEYVESIIALRQQLADAQAANGALKTALTKLYTAARAIEEFVPMNEEVRPNIYFKLSAAIGDAAKALQAASADGSASAASADDENGCG